MPRHVKRWKSFPRKMSGGTKNCPCSHSKEKVARGTAILELNCLAGFNHFRPCCKKILLFMHNKTAPVRRHFKSIWLLMQGWKVLLAYHCGDDLHSAVEPR